MGTTMAAMGSGPATDAGSESGRSQAPPAEGSPALIGRAEELAMLLRCALPGAIGPGAVALVTGEPGIGKSRLAEEFAVTARQHGAEVHWGRCWEAGGAPPYWPWTQVIRSHLRSSGPGLVGAAVGARAQTLAPLVPELGSTGPDAGPSELTPASDSDRFRLFEAVASVLRAAADGCPLVIIIDDLHAADTPSLLLLQFLAADLADCPVSFLALYRSLELAGGPALATAEAALLRLPNGHRLALTGLEPGDVAELMQRTSGHGPSPAQVAAVHERTDGNPLFVAEIARLLGSTPQPLQTGTMGRVAIPEGIRDAIGRRLERLGESTTELLRIAAVLGREVPLDVVASMTERHVVTLLADLDEALVEGLLVTSPVGVGHMRFSHDLVRECLYEDLGAVRRRQLHLRAGEVLEELHVHDRDVHVAELAHHFFVAAPDGDLHRAARYARLAGEAALRGLAYEEAARMFRMALQLADALPPAADPADRCELLLLLGDADGRAGDLATARESFREAATLARRAELPEALAAAATSYGGRFVWMRAGKDREMVVLLEDALRALPEGDSPLRVQVLSRLAGALRDEVDPERRDRLSREAADMARRLGDVRSLAYALASRFGALWSPEHTDERLAIALEHLETATAAGDKEEEIAARLALSFTRWELGDLDAVRSDLGVLDVLTGEIRQPAQRWALSSVNASLALFEGRFGDGRRLLEEGFLRGRASLMVDAEAAHALAMYVLRREQGRAEEVRPALEHAEREFAGYIHFPAVLAHLDLEAGRPIEARLRLHRFIRDGVEASRHDNYGLLALSLIAEVAAGLDDVDAASSVYAALAPYADRHALGPPEAAVGVVHRPLGVLAATLGRWEEAVAHFDAALAVHARTGARPWLAWTQYQCADALARRGAGDDFQRASELVTAARLTAQALGMVVLERRIDEALAGITAAGAVADGADGGEGPIDAFVRDGDHWFISFDGSSFRLRDSKGLHYIATLLASPGRDIAALDLATGGGTGGPSRVPDDDLRERRRSPDEPALDDAARTAYRRRLTELEEELEEAEAWGDAERAARARAETEFLAAELAAAVGLGGRARQLSSDAERARQSVRKAISSALERIGREDAALAGHLTGAITTGYMCSYQPDPRAAPDWSL